MQPTTTTSPIRARRLLGAGVLAATLLLAGCGGGSDEESSGTDGSTETTVSDSGTETTTADSGTDATEPAGDGTPDADVCGTITAEDVQGILPGADPLTATPNTAIPAPTCDYTIEIGDDSFAMTAAVVQIQWAGDASYYEGQKELQTDATEIPELEQGFAFNDGGTILLTTDAGTWTVIRGVEINAEATAAVTPEQLVEIATLVQDRL